MQNAYFAYVHYNLKMSYKYTLKFKENLLNLLESFFKFFGNLVDAHLLDEREKTKAFS